MDKSNFEAIFPIITSHLAAMIAEESNLPEDDAITELYNSALYAVMEKEETKVWQYSTEKLYDIFKNEKISGKLELPEY